MDKIKIMEASVVKWQRIISKKGADGGVYDCPPCRIYYWVFCNGCPISEYTGKKFCKGTPYVDWFWHHQYDHGHLRRKIFCPDCLRMATAMRDFMKEIVDHLKAQSVKPEGDPPSYQRMEKSP
jgi:hypothetical protein